MAKKAAKKTAPAAREAVTWRFQPALMKRLRAAADDNRRSINNMAEQVIEAGLDALQQKPGHE